VPELHAALSINADERPRRSALPLRSKLWRDFNQEIRELLDRSPIPLSELVVEIRRLKELQRASIRHPDADGEFR